ncbi:MAG: tetratricopeptide repeat protein [Polyangiaceae bacterium]
MKQRRTAPKGRPQPALSAALQRSLDAALAQHARGEIEAALEVYREVLATSPDDVDARLNLGAGLTSLGRPNDALPELRRAQKIARRLPRAQNDIGVCFAELGRYDEAIEAFTAAVTLAPEHVEAWKNLGYALNEAGREEQAAQALGRCLLLEPLLALGWFELSRSVFDAANPRPAVEALSRAVASDPAYRWARYALGVALDVAGDARAAKEMHAALVKEAPTFADAVDGWRYIRERKGAGTRLVMTTRRGLEIALAAASLEGAILEFGVRYAVTTRWIAEGSGGRAVHGFDSFRGLPEPWLVHPAGAYSTHGQAPEVPSNVTLHVGLFEETLPPFARGLTEPLRLLHVDCDLYSATKTVLDGLGDRVAPGTIVVFDEYVVNQGWRDDEFKAFQEAVAARGWRYEYLAFGPVTGQAVIRIVA